MRLQSRDGTNARITKSDKALVTPAVTPVSIMGKRNARTSSHENEALAQAPKHQPSKKVKTASATSTSTPSQAAAESQDQGASTSAMPIALSTESSAASMLTTIVFGGGECGELGLGHKETASLVGRANPSSIPKGRERSRWSKSLAAAYIPLP
ncbi:hypothetical protein ACHAQJ_006543 [Trichoderma viride]